MNIRDLPNLDIFKVCEMFGYPIPKKPEVYENYLVFNEFTAVPYLLVSSKIIENKPTSFFLIFKK